MSGESTSATRGAVAPAALSLLPPALVYLVAVAAQCWRLPVTMLPSTDEGIYLYSARLLLDGVVPYRDFFLSHPPPVFLASAAAFRLVGLDPTRFSFLYVFWVFTIVFPIYRTVVLLTRRRLPAILAIVLLVTYPDFARWDARFLAMRQASLPFYAFALPLLVTRRGPVLAGLLLAAFSLCVVSNGAIVVLTFAALAVGAALSNDGAARAWWTQQKAAVLAWAAACALGYGAFALIPGFVRDVFVFQLDRVSVPMIERAKNVWNESLPASGLMLALGWLGAALAIRASRGLSLVALLGVPLTVFGYGYYSAHHLAAVAAAMAVSAGVALSRLMPTRRTAVALTAAIVVALSVSALPALASSLFAPATTSTFAIADRLSRCPEPLFTAQPLYALFARRRLTMHRYVADMRCFAGSSLKPVDDRTFADIVARSNTVLIEPLLLTMLDKGRFELLAKDFEIAYQDPYHGILVRKGAQKRMSLQSFRRLPGNGSPRSDAASSGVGSSS